MKNKRDENLLHEAFWEWAQYHPKIEPFLFGIEHGIKLNAIVAMNQKRRGVKGGIPDFWFMKPNKKHSSLFIEFKIKPNKLTPAQKRFFALAKECGHKCVEAFSLAEGIKKLTDYCNNKI